MGIRNREGALYFATGVDNTGLYTGRREAMGIIKAMTSEITSFDVFGGIGISAAAAFASAGKEAYQFEKAFQKSMLEVATISQEITNNLSGYQKSIIGLTQDIPVMADDAAKALYQIVSAGHDGAAGMKILEVSAKSAIGGVTETATVADAITTLINAYKMSADDAAKISDQLFTTARLGKTTFGELGQSIAQVAPIAASYGVEMDQVLAAVATLTKSGTPTAQAMTQIRASIIGVSKVLGDGAFDGRTYQEALAEIAKRAKGSESKLRELVPEIEAVNGVLGLTGINAQAAAGDLLEMNNSVGATNVVFKKMSEGAEAQLQLLSNNITAITRSMGEEILKRVSDVASGLNEAFKNGDIESSLESLKTMIILVSGAFVAYKANAIGAAVATSAETVATNLLTGVKTAYNTVSGANAIAKEKERVTQEAYTLSLEKTITEEQRARLSKMNLQKGSAEYSNALSNMVQKEKQSIDSQIESLTKSIAKQKENLSVAKEKLQSARDAAAAAKKEFEIAFEANDLAGVEIAQSKLHSATKREESASVNVSTISKKINNQEKKLGLATSASETIATNISTASKAGETVATNVLTAAKTRAVLATRALTAAIAANPIGALLTVISLAVSAMMLYGKETEKTATALERINDAVNKQKENTDNLLNTFYEENEAERKRVEALDKLKALYPDVWAGVALANLADLDRNRTLKETNTLLDENREKEIAAAIAKSKSNIADVKKKGGDIVVRDKEGNEYRSYSSKQKDIITNETKNIKELQAELDKTTVSKKALAYQKLTKDEKIALRKKELEDLEGQIKEVTDRIAEANKTKLTFGGFSFPEFPSVDEMKLNALEEQQKKAKIEVADLEKPVFKTNDQIEKEAEAAKKRRKAIEEINKTVLEVELKLQREKNALLRDGRVKVLEQIELERKQRIAAINQEQKDLSEKYKEVVHIGPVSVDITDTVLCIIYL